MIPVFRPSLDDEEVAALREVIHQGWIGAGPKTREFERCFAEFVGAPYAIGLNSATAALHLALHVTDVTEAEVITTSLTFVSTNHAIRYSRGIPVFADVEPETLNLDPESIRRVLTPRTKAIVVVHYGGHSCDMDPILELARERGLTVVEDCAHACGGTYRGRMLGTLGTFGCFSFHAVKNLATGDGGMITTFDEATAQRLRKLSWLGISRDTWDRYGRSSAAWWYYVDEIGFKYHMNDLAATIGMVQLAKLARTNARRRALAQRYHQALADLDWIERPIEKAYARSAWHNYVVKVVDPADRDPLMAHLRHHDVATSVHYIPNHLYPIYAPFATQPLPVTESVWRRIVTLPLFPDLTDEQQDAVVTALRSYRS